MKTGKNTQTQRQKNLFEMASGGFLITVTNNSLNDSIYVPDS